VPSSFTALRARGVLEDFMRLRPYSFLVIAIFTTLMGRASCGEAKDPLLRGLSKVEILFEELNGDSLACGLDINSLKTSASYPLLESGLQIEPKYASSVPTLYFNISSHYLRSADSCFSVINVRLYGMEYVKLEFQEKAMFSEVNLWSYGGMLSSLRGRHADRVANELQMFMKEFIVAWKLDNQPRNSREQR
jgi:hypothetical protein